MAAIATQAAQLYLLALEIPSFRGNIGVALLDSASNTLHVRLRRDWEQLAPNEVEVLSELEDDLAGKASQLGAAALLAHLEDTLSNTLRLSEPREVLVEGSANGWERALGRQYRQHVETQAQPYVTHLPRYTLAVAAGRFLDNEEIEEEGYL